MKKFWLLLVFLITSCQNSYNVVMVSTLEDVPAATKKVYLEDLTKNIYSEVITRNLVMLLENNGYKMETNIKKADLYASLKITNSRHQESYSVPVFGSTSANSVYNTNAGASVNYNTGVTNFYQSTDIYDITCTTFLIYTLHKGSNIIDKMVYDSGVCDRNIGNAMTFAREVSKIYELNFAHGNINKKISCEIKDEQSFCE